MQNYSASVSGATEKINYYLSGTYTDQQGVVKGDDYDRTALTARLQSDITDWLQLGGQVNKATALTINILCLIIVVFIVKWI